ncbi:2-oxoglutarate dehydrogenase complex dihydrolipoyllysine-residue succinyltransferase [Candidatus Protochlamydia phocaeensis]|uniref:2-oxoglutarate dehydrogenase complex dihydrolipoyllysine-residue succinyltransferase n=1 Tax=Candidatus Protochlamydia phocaeensis TaxID=1414722 RepID=UPI00083931D5|nr:2-oxoglutarate dehydrogenase complex dihydrolipoyllysine-residue succinyltransferase [Candidatus Protochlamydia phocaeensis]
MKSEIKIPSMGESISEAVIGQVFAPDGTIVKADGELLELETDKVNQVLYAPQTGRVALSVKTGDTVKIGQVIGTIEEAPQEKSQAPSSAETMAKEIPKEKEGKDERKRPVAEQQAEARPESFQQEQAPIRQTKAAFLADLQTAQKEQRPAPSRQEGKAQAAASSKEQQVRRETRKPLSKIRKVIASRLVEAQQTTAMLTTFNEVDMSQIVQLREKYQEKFTKKYGTKLGFMSFFVKAVVSALQAYPQVNSYLEGDDIVQREYYDIGVAVGTDRGTIVPVIRNCDRLTFFQIEQAIDVFAKKAREGSIAIEDLQGGGFTITNGGVYGSLLSTPILNPPQCGILGMHKIEKRPVVVDDQIVIRPMMYLALSYDHRLIDGKDSVSFLVHIKNQLEDPSRLLLDL